MLFCKRDLISEKPAELLFVNISKLFFFEEIETWVMFPVVSGFRIPESSEIVGVLGWPVPCRVTDW